MAGPLAVVAVPRDARILLYGSRGSGKSSLALAAFTTSLVVTTEMEPSLVLAYARRMGTRAEVRTADWLGEAPDLQGLAHVEGVILDSISGWPEEPIAVVRRGEAVAAQLRCPLVCIAQITADERERGGPVVGHYVDVIGRVEQAQGVRLVSIEKNRFGDCRATSFTLGAEEATGLYYTVVGQAPRYRLAAYPWHPSRVWDAAAARKLTPPEPPAACAAEYSALYGGWVEPPDRAARAAFAESQGVAYWSPRQEMS